MDFILRLLRLGRQPIPLASFHRILIIRPDDIGDVVLFSPFLRGIRDSAPSSYISVLANETCSVLIENCPYVDSVHTLPFDSCMTESYQEDLVVRAKDLRGTMNPREFDLILIPRADRDIYGAGLVARELAGPAKIYRSQAAFIKSKDRPRENNEVATRVFRIRNPQSEVDSNIEFLRAIGGKEKGNHLEFWNSQEDFDSVNNWLSREKIQGPFIVFHPLGSRSKLRRWPKGRCRELVKRIISTTEFSVVVVGGSLDEFIRDEFSDFHEPRFHFCLNQFTLPQLGALIKKSGYFVGGDSGPMHIAAAVGAKTVGIFGPGSQVRFGPHSSQSEVVSLKLDCSPDQRRSYEAACHTCIHEVNFCLAKIEVDMVMERIRSWTN
jgi:heptosyltransferase-2